MATAIAMAKAQAEAQVEWSGVDFSGVKLFQIVLASPASKSLIFPTKIDIALRRFSEKQFSWLQNDQQDELHLQLFKISRKVQLLVLPNFGRFKDL